MATHNLAAPIQIFPENFAYGRVLADKIFDLIKGAIASEDPNTKYILNHRDLRGH